MDTPAIVNISEGVTTTTIQSCGGMAAVNSLTGVQICRIL